MRLYFSGGKLCPTRRSPGLVFVCCTVSFQHLLWGPGTAGGQVEAQREQLVDHRDFPRRPPK